MGRDRQTVSNRRARILATVREQQQARVEELAETFDVSLMTIRRDLQVLEEAGLLTRFYGGASVESRIASAGGSDETILEYRRVIARCAASMLGDGESVFINGSSTALLTLDYLGDKRVNVYTNNGKAASKRYADGVVVTFLGGTIRRAGHIMTGDCTMRNLLTVSANTALLGCTGISPDGEILCDIPTELGINETMVAHADRCLILADHTKVGKTGTYASCSLEKACTVITDELAPRDVVTRLEAIGMTVVQLDRTGGVVGGTGAV